MNVFLHFLLLLIFCTANAVWATDSTTLQKVSLQLEWKHQFEFAGFYAAKEKGFYQDAGFDVDLVEYDGKLNIVTEVIEGKKTFGVRDSQLIGDRLEGKPVVMLTNYLKRSPLVIVTKPDIHQPNDLKNKRVMGTLKDLNNISFATVFKQFGMKLADFTFVQHDFTGQSFIDGNVDAATVYLTNELFKIQQSNVAYNILDPSNYGSELYGIGLFTTENYAKQNPDKTRAFAEASNKGWNYALEHSDEIVDVILKKYNSQQKSKAALEFEAKETAKIMLPNVYPIGSIDYYKVRRIAEIFVQMGQAKNIEPLNGFVFDATKGLKPDPTLNLTDSELNFLKKHPVIRVSNETEVPPYDFIENGKPVGYSVELMQLLVQKMGVSIEFVTNKSWDKLLDSFCKGKIDVMHVADKGEASLACGTFSPAYIKATTQFLTRKDFKTVKTIEDLYGSTIATPKAWEQTELLQKFYGKKLKIIETDDTKQSIELVRHGKADATLDFADSLNYYATHEGYTNTKIEGILNMNESESFDELYIQSRKGLPALQGILNKALASLSATEIQALQAKWFGKADDNAANEIKRITLTPDEQTYLAAHPIIRAGNQSNSPPFDFAINNQAQGYNVDLLNLLAQRVGFRVHYETRSNFDGLLQMHHENKIDLMSGVSFTSELGKVGVFSSPPYIRTKSVYVTRKNKANIENLKQLNGKRVAIDKGWSVEDFLKKEYPAIKLLPFGTLEQMLDAVSTGQAETLIQEKNTLEYWLSKNTMSDLKIGGWVNELDNSKPNSFYFYARPDGKALISMLNKAYATLTPKEMRELQSRWLLIYDGANNAKKIPLIPEEESYLTQKGTIKFCVMPDWLPYGRINEKGEHEGIGAEMIKQMSERLDAKFELYPTKDWTESQTALREHRCDMLPLASDIASRRDDMDFTKPYFINPLVVATLANELFIKDASEIGNRTVGIGKNRSFIEKLKTAYPSMKIVEVKDAKEGLERVQKGEIWGYVDAMPSVAYILQNGEMVDLKISGKLEIDHELSVATRKDEPQLAQIMQKVIDAISEEERREIMGKWLSVRFEQNADYGRLLRVFGIVAVVAFVIITVIVISHRRLSKVNKSLDLKSEQIASLLNNSGQGFLSFGADLVVVGEFSHACIAFFGKEPLGISVDELLFPDDAKKRELLKECVADALSQTSQQRKIVFLSLIPKEIHLQDRVLNAEFIPIEPNIMVVLSDITQEYKLQKKIERESKRVHMILEAVTNLPDFFATTEEFHHFAQAGKNAWQNETISSIYRAIHTFKGSFNQFGFYHVPEALHDVETTLQNIKGTELCDELAAFVFEIDWQNLLDQDLATVTDALGADFFNRGSAVTMTVDQARLVEQIVREYMVMSDAKLKDNYQEALEELAQIRSISLRYALQDYDRLIQQAAKSLEKEVQLVVEGDDVKLDPEIFRPFLQNLGHVFRNGVDHGIEDPETRYDAGKDEFGTITCQVTHTETGFDLEISDNGGGINIDALRNKAARMGESDTSAWTLADLVFADGVSSRDVATDLSGRGVGMSAVRAEVEKLGGEVTVDTHLKQGTTFVFKVPVNG